MKKKDKEKNEKDEIKKYYAVEDCVVTHQATVFFYKKRQEVTDETVIEILKPQGLLSEEPIEEVK